jgi:hypothetical protein
MTKNDYKIIRARTKDLAYKILYSTKNKRDEMIYAGILLGFWDGKEMVFETEEENDVLMDFLIYERGKKGDKLITNFYNSEIQLDEIEEEIIEGLNNYYSSLFEIKDIDTDSNILFLSDLFDKDLKEYKLMDVGFSMTAKIGLIIYTRLIPIKDINMTSGVSFAFNSSDKNRVLSDFSFLRFKKKGRVTSTDFFVLAFKKSKQCGINVYGTEMN